MHTTLTEAGPFERTLTVTVADAELESAKEKAARRLSREMKVKGFRPGKVPRRIVESMVGADRLRSEALEEALPDIVTNALRDAEVVPAVVPAITATRDTDDGVEVDVRITLWPRLDAPPKYAGRHVVVDAPEVGEEELDEHLDRFRSQFAELEAVARPAQEEDFALIDVTVSLHGRALEDASARDLLYELGSHSFIPGLDEQLAGTRPGAIVEFTAPLPQGFGEHGGKEAQVRVLVKDIQGRRLPELTDDWVAEVSEFETVAELREGLTDNVRAFKLREVASEFRGRLLEQLVGDLELELPEPLVEAETEESAHRFLHRLEASGIDLGTYLQITGTDQQQFLEDLRSQADRNLRVRILLDAIAVAEEIEVTAEEIDDLLDRMAAASGSTPAQYRKDIAGSGRVEALAGDILRQKALDRLVERASPVDAEGNPVSLETPDRTGDVVDAIIEPDDEPVDGIVEGLESVETAE